jgi:hypothetical protein
MGCVEYRTNRRSINEHRCRFGATNSADNYHHDHDDDYNYDHDDNNHNHSSANVNDNHSSANVNDYNSSANFDDSGANNKRANQLNDDVSRSSIVDGATGSSISCNSSTTIGKHNDDDNYPLNQKEFIFINTYFKFHFNFFDKHHSPDTSCPNSSARGWRFCY